MTTQMTNALAKSKQRILTGKDFDIIVQCESEQFDGKEKLEYIAKMNKWLEKICNEVLSKL